MMSALWNVNHSIVVSCHLFPSDIQALTETDLSLVSEQSKEKIENVECFQDIDDLLPDPASSIAHQKW